jgi:hypothetical protein
MVRKSLQFDQTTLRILPAGTRGAEYSEMSGPARLFLYILSIGGLLLQPQALRKMWRLFMCEQKLNINPNEFSRI